VSEDYSAHGGEHSAASPSLSFVCTAMREHNPPKLPIDSLFPFLVQHDHGIGLSFLQFHVFFLSISVKIFGNSRFPRTFTSRLLIWTSSKCSTIHLYHRDLLET